MNIELTINEAVLLHNALIEFPVALKVSQPLVGKLEAHINEAIKEQSVPAEAGQPANQEATPLSTSNEQNHEGEQQTQEGTEEATNGESA